jgi:hypothetical protein
LRPEPTRPQRPIDETAILRVAFDECDLPYRVDIVDWQAIGDDFRGLIAADRHALTETPVAR